MKYYLIIALTAVSLKLQARAVNAALLMEIAIPKFVSTNTVQVTTNSPFKIAKTGSFAH